ncbi:flippase [candidate division KSB1 bacterium]|nr:flippase [candidate division KSB1 bacterium]
MNDYKEQQAIRTMARGAGIVFIGMILARIFGYLLRIALKHSIGLEDFGLISTGVVVVELAAIVALMGMQLAVARYIAFFSSQKQENKIAGTLKSSFILGMSSLTVVALAIRFFAQDIAIKLFDKPELLIILKYFWILIPVWGFILLASSVMRGFKNMGGTILTQQLTRPLFVLISFGLLALSGTSLSTAIFGYLSGFILTAVLAFFLLVRGTPVLAFFRVKAVNVTKEILNYSWPLVFATILWSMTGRMGTFLLSIYESKANVGVFSAVLPLAQFVAVSMLSFGMILMPLFSSIFSHNDLPQLRIVYNAATKWILFFTVIVFVPLFVYSFELLTLFFGADTQSGSTALKLISIGYLIYAIFGPCNLVLNASGKTKFVFLNNFSAFVLNVGLAFLLIPRFGIEGAAIASMGSFTILALFSVVENLIFYKVSPFHLPFYKNLFSIALGTALVYLTRNLLFPLGSGFQILGGSVVFMISYTLLLYFFRVFDQSDLIIIEAMEKKFNRKFKVFRAFIR